MLLQFFKQGRHQLQPVYVAPELLFQRSYRGPAFPVDLYSRCLDVCVYADAYHRVVYGLCLGAQVKQFMAQENVPAESAGLRVSVLPGGCSGFKYGVM